MAWNNCPLSSIRGKDDQSDTEACRLMNPKCLKNLCYDDPGWNLLQFCNALCFGGWNASHAFTCAELFKNACTSYYMMLVLTMVAHEHRGKKLWLSFLPQPTSRNLMRMLGNLVLRLHNWPSNMVLEPSLCAEDSIEHFFGQVKTQRRGTHGTSSTANSIQSTQLLHSCFSWGPASSSPKMAPTFLSETFGACRERMVH